MKPIGIRGIGQLRFHRQSGGWSVEFCGRSPAERGGWSPMEYATPEAARAAGIEFVKATLTEALKSLETL